MTSCLNLRFRQNITNMTLKLATKREFTKKVSKPGRAASWLPPHTSLCVDVLTFDQLSTRQMFLTADGNIYDFGFINFTSETHFSLSSYDFLSKGIETHKISECRAKTGLFNITFQANQESR